MTKSELRKIYKDKRKAFSSTEIDEMSYAILEKLKTLPIGNANSFHVFLSISRLNEINTNPIIDFLFAQNKQVIVPKIVDNKMLNCVVKKGFETELGEFSVPEPKEFQLIESDEIEVVILPMLICDKSGNRVGYGAGFYDQFLKTCTENVVKIGINYFEPIAQIDDVDVHDIPLDYCVTPTEIVSFLTGKSFISKK